MRKKEDVFWAVEGTFEILECETTDEAIHYYLDNSLIEIVPSCGVVTVIEYKRMSPEVVSTGCGRSIAGIALDSVVDLLEEEYGNPSEDDYGPTAAMVEAANVFAEVILSEYVPWAMVPTGRVEEVDIHDWCLKHNPDWIQATKPRIDCKQKY